MMSRYTYHTDGTQAAADEIFVFGSNEAGRHGAGAAKAALLYYGAVYGEGYGLQGRSYAIPTKDENIQTLDLNDIEDYIYIFIVEAALNPSKKYFMTRIGCGLAGYNDEDIAPLFKHAPTNINFPEDWRTYLED
jgi:hypothetical protein